MQLQDFEIHELYVSKIKSQEIIISFVYLEIISWNQFECSGFTEFMLKKLGKNISHVSTSKYFSEIEINVHSKISLLS